jgi:nitrogen regulatory protein PII
MGEHKKFFIKKLGNAMHFKLVIVFVEDDKTDLVLNTARANGAKGATVINHARGEGLKQSKTFFGLTLETQRDVLLFLVEERLSRHILEKIAKAAEFDSKPGTGIAFQIDVEDAIGVMHQVEELTHELEENI